jgi:hypothetical protein
MTKPAGTTGGVEVRFPVKSTTYFNGPQVGVLLVVIPVRLCTWESRSLKDKIPGSKTAITAAVPLPL